MYSITDFNIFRNGEQGILTTFVRDPHNNQLADVYATSKFELVDISNDQILLSENFSPDGGTYVTHQSRGVYQVEIDTTVYKKEYLLALSCVMDGETVGYNTYFKSVSSKHFKYAAILRGYVDKAQKSMADYIENMDREGEAPLKLFFGYADANLIFYLERGLQYINFIPPYTVLNIDLFPFNHNGAILIDAATIAALEAQGIFSIDSDYDYSLGGNSMVIDHYTKLSNAVAAIVERFQKAVVPFKNQYLTKGFLLHQFMPGGVRDMRFLTALPSGFWSRMLSGSWG
jgi:hypothetical protein